MHGIAHLDPLVNLPTAFGKPTYKGRHPARVGHDGLQCCSHLGGWLETRLSIRICRSAGGLLL